MHPLGMGGALHVSRTMVVMLSVREFTDLQASCHCSPVRWLCLNSCISLSIWFELLSKNLMWKSLTFSFNMGLSILGGGSKVINGVLAINVFEGICSCMGK